MLTSPIKDSSLSGSTTGRVRDLSGYSKPKQPLASHNDWERSFVENAGRMEISDLSTTLFEQLRESFRYKRRELIYACNGATASIRCPDFEVNVSLTQHPDEVERYVSRVEVRSFRNSIVLEDPRFLAIFDQHCNTVVFDLVNDLDIEATIDGIEDVDVLSNHLEYDPACTQFTLRLPSPGIILRATRNQLVFCLDGRGDLKTLLSTTHQTIEQLIGNKIALGIREL